ncbi:class I SAM-dependent methyltransferase [Spirillospora sp. NBC_00431]
MYGEDLAEVYEIVYRSRGKDWGAEAGYVAELIRERRPDADSLLDVACGTGAHLETFDQLFEHTEGLDAAEPMLRLAGRRLPNVTLHKADMREIRLSRSFDAVTCMFCAIGYLPTPEDMHSAIRSMARHLLPGGVLVVEPWWFPGKHIEGYVAGDLARENGKTVARISHSRLEGRATRMEVRFLVGEASGIKEFTEIDKITLFTHKEYVSAFESAGCSVEYLAGEPTGRGLFIGVRQSLET